MSGDYTVILSLRRQKRMTVSYLSERADKHMAVWMAAFSLQPETGCKMIYGTWKICFKHRLLNVRQASWNIHIHCYWSAAICAALKGTSHLKMMFSLPTQTWQIWRVNTDVGKLEFIHLVSASWLIHLIWREVSKLQASFQIGEYTEITSCHVVVEI